MADLMFPYPGLRAFTRDESHLFFGREGCVDSMIERLAATRFLAVLGASGSGKSSLVRTGLLDGLELGYHATAGSRWLVVDTHPGGAPMRNLAGSLARTMDGHTTQADIEVMRAFLARGPRSLVDLCRSGRLAAGTNLLLLVDQFEELFRYADYAAREEAEAFCALLLESARAADVPIHVVLTMRSEYLGACALVSGLAETINAGFYLTPRMSREECRSAIEGPARVCGFHIEPALVNTMLNDMAGFAPWEHEDGVRQSQLLSRRADQLPLMQHVLNRLWLKAQTRAGGGPVVLTLRDYQAEGGLTGALDAHGAEILGTLASADREHAPALLRCLVSGPDLANAVRRPCSFAELAEAVPGGAEPARRIVEAFRANGCNFLMPPPPESIEGGTLIDIGHESLIRQWNVLARLLEAEARAAGEWARLRQTAKRHEEGRGSLLAGADLASTQAWWNADRPTPQWAVRHGGDHGLVSQYVALSTSAEEEALRVEAAQRQEKERQVRKQRNTYFAFVVTLLPLLLAAGFFGWQAKRSAGDAERQRLEAVSQGTEADRQRAEAVAKSKELEQSLANEGKLKTGLAQSNAELTRESEARQVASAALERSYGLLRPYEDYIAIAEVMRAANFVRNPAISSDAVGIAMSGFDPVSYFQGGPVRGLLQHFTIHDGAIWLFSSADNRNRFLAQPARYMPQFGGYCAPCMASDSWLHGRPTVWHLHEGRLYLASTPVNRQYFVEDPQSFLQAASVNYAKGKDQKNRKDAPPYFPTVAGKVLQSYRLAQRSPDAYAILQASAMDYARAGDYYAAADQQREAVDLLKSSTGRGARRDEQLASALTQLVRHRLRLPDFAGGAQAAQEAIALAPQSTEVLAWHAIALLLDERTHNEGRDLLRRNLGRTVGGTELAWEEYVYNELSPIRWPKNIEKNESEVLNQLLATPANCLRNKADAVESERNFSFSEAAKHQEDHAACLRRLPESSKRRTDELPQSLIDWAAAATRTQDLPLMLRATADFDARDLGTRAQEMKAYRLAALLLATDIAAGRDFMAQNLPSASADNTSFEARFLIVYIDLYRKGVRSERLQEAARIANTSRNAAKLAEQSNAARDKRDYKFALAKELESFGLLEQLPRGARLTSAMAGSYSAQAWLHLLMKDTPAASKAVDAGLALEPDRLYLHLRKAHVTLAMGRIEEAVGLYQSGRGKTFRDGQKWEAFVVEELDQLEKELGPLPGSDRARAAFK